MKTEITLPRRMGADHDGRIRHAGLEALRGSFRDISFAAQHWIELFHFVVDCRDRAHLRRQLQPDDRNDHAYNRSLTTPGLTGAWSFDTVPGLARLAKEIARQSIMIGYLDISTPS
jgi:hypothetical protein